MISNKKIVFIGPLPPPLGGVAMINQSFQSLIFEGYDTMSFDTSNKSLREDLYKGRPWKNLGKEYSKFRQLKRSLIDGKPDIANVFVTSGYSIVRDICYLRILNKQKIPVIIHFHSKKTGEFALKPWRLKLLGKIFNKYSEKILVLSKDHFFYFTKFFNKNKCEILENFVSYSDFENNPLEKTDQFLFVGRLSKEKGFFDLLEACRILKNKNNVFKVDIIGVAPSLEVQGQISEIVKENQLESVLKFHGLKFGNEKFDLFKQSKILLFPSHFENSPVVIKEAIAAKLGIIASDIEANQIILKGKGVCEFHKVEDSENLANTIESLLNDSKKTTALCRATEFIKEYDKIFAQKKLLTIMNTLC